MSVQFQRLRGARRATSLLPIASLVFAMTMTAPASTALAAPVQAPPAAPAAPAPPIAKAPDTFAAWADAVWLAAKAGDFSKVDSLLSNPPQGVDDADLVRFREMVGRRADHAKLDGENLEKQVAERRAEVRKALDADDLSRALVAAANLKFLCTQWSCELEKKDIAEAITRAESQAEKAETGGEWLQAQEMLFRLRSMYEDTRDADHYRKWDARLDRVNRRIGLLAEYAPKTLYDLRSRFNDRLKEARKKRIELEGPDAVKGAKDPKSGLLGDDREDDNLPPFVESAREEWKDQVKGITSTMLTEALKKIAGEHIDNKGWRPLLIGGLDAMDLLGTTDSLKETFPGLGDAAKVKSWREAVARNRDAIETMGPDRVGRSVFKDMCSDLLAANKASIDLPEEVILKEFGEGAIYVLSRDFEDLYSEIIWPERLHRFRQAVDGKLIGVGIQIRHDDKREIMVANPLEGSPASREGVRAKDRIIAVDGQPTTGWSLNKAVDNITGQAGKSVKLTLRREGEEKPIDVNLVREPIKLRSVNGWWKKNLDPEGNPEWDWFIDPAGGIGYVRLTSFNEDSFADFKIAVSQMKAERKLNGLILDLRGNPGGLLGSAVDFVNAFVDRGEIVSCQNRLGEKVANMTRKAQMNQAFLLDLPLVVLVNQGSASASEIVSGSLEAHDAAVVIGERSFGKGSVQEVAPISERGHEAAVKVTTQYYVLPPEAGKTKGRLVHKRPGAEDWGVNPQLVIKMSPDQIEKSIELRQRSDAIAEVKGTDDQKPRPDPKDLLSKGIDPQLEYALVVLEARILKDLEAAKIARGQ